MLVENSTTPIREKGAWKALAIGDSLRHGLDTLQSTPGGLTA